MLSYRKGFTLVELLVVMGIILILVSIGIPAVNVARNKAKEMQVKAGCNEIQKALEAYAVSHGGTYPGANWVEDSAGNFAVGPGLIGGLPTYLDPATPRKDFYVPQDNSQARGLSGLNGEPVYFPDGTPNPNQLDALVLEGFLTSYPPNPFLATSGGLKAQMSNLFLFNPILGTSTPTPANPDTLDWNRYTRTDSMRQSYVDYGRGHFTYIPLNPVNNTGIDYVGRWDDNSLSDAERSDYYKRCRGYILVGWGASRMDDTLAKGLSMQYWDPSLDGGNGAYDFDLTLSDDQMERVLSNTTASGILQSEMTDSDGSFGSFGQVLPNGAPSIDEAFFGAVFLKITGS